MPLLKLHPFLVIMKGRAEKEGRKMAKLYFKYGAMGSSKTAQALITKYNYEENDMHVWLMKPGTDTRDGKNVVKSRIGLKAEAQVISPEMDVYEIYRSEHHGCPCP